MMCWIHVISLIFQAGSIFKLILFQVTDLLFVHCDEVLRGGTPFEMAAPIRPES